MSYTKRQVMELVASGIVDESFVYEDGTVYNITALRMLAKKTNRKPILAFITQQLIDLVQNERDIDYNRIQDLKDHLNDPAILIDQGDGSHLIIDGNHRIIARYFMGLIDFPAYVFEKQEALAACPMDEMVDAGIEWGSEAFNNELKSKINEAK